MDPDAIPLYEDAWASGYRIGEFKGDIVARADLRIEPETAVERVLRSMRQQCVDLGGNAVTSFKCEIDPFGEGANVYASGLATVLLPLFSDTPPELPK